MLYKREKLSSGRLASLKAANHKIALKNGFGFIAEQPYRSRQRTYDVIRENVEKKL